MTTLSESLAIDPWHRTREQAHACIVATVLDAAKQWRRCDRYEAGHSPGDCGCATALHAAVAALVENEAQEGGGR
jgi:hypothetical protein